MAQARLRNRSSVLLKVGVWGFLCFLWAAAVSGSPFCCPSDFSSNVLGACKTRLQHTSRFTDRGAAGFGRRASPPASADRQGSSALSTPLADALQSFLDHAERQLAADKKQQEEYSKSTTEVGLKFQRLRSATIRRTRKLRDTAAFVAAATDEIRNVASSRGASSESGPGRVRDVGRVLRRLSRQVGRYQAIFDRTEGMYEEVCSDVDVLIQQAGQRVLELEKEQRSQTEFAKLAGFVGLLCLPVAIVAEAPVMAALSFGGGTVAAAMTDSANQYGDLSKYYSQMQQALGIVLDRIRGEKDKVGNVKESLEDASLHLEEAQLDWQDEEWSTLAVTASDLRKAFSTVVDDCDDFLQGAQAGQYALKA